MSLDGLTLSWEIWLEAQNIFVIYRAVHSCLWWRAGWEAPSDRLLPGQQRRTVGRMPRSQPLKTVVAPRMRPGSETWQLWTFRENYRKLNKYHILFSVEKWSVIIRDIERLKRRSVLMSVVKKFILNDDTECLTNKRERPGWQVIVSTFIWLLAGPAATCWDITVVVMWVLVWWDRRSPESYNTPRSA